MREKKRIRPQAAAASCGFWRHRAMSPAYLSISMGPGPCPVPGALLMPWGCTEKEGMLLLLLLQKGVLK